VSSCEEDRCEGEAASSAARRTCAAAACDLLSECVWATRADKVQSWAGWNRSVPASWPLLQSKGLIVSASTIGPICMLVIGIHNHQGYQVLCPNLGADHPTRRC
jgi:hypothetical protein